MANFWATALEAALGIVARQAGVFIGLFVFVPAALAQSTSPWADGIYVYGGSDRRGEIGTGYVVLEVRSAATVGVVYYPRSEYSCVFGEAGAREVELTVVDPYDRSEHPYAIAVQSETVAGVGATVGLDGYHRLGEPTAQEREMLAVCKTDHPRVLPP